MELQQVMLPTHPWSQIKPHIKSIGEGEHLTPFDLGDDYEFLIGIGVIDETNTGELTNLGKALFEASFIRRDAIEEEKIIRSMLLEFPPTQAIQQYLWGIKDVNIDQVLTVLKTTGFWIFEEKRLLTHFLDLLNLGKIIKYDRKNRKISVLVTPDQTKIPRSIYIEPERPYGNVYWAKRVLAECEGFIYWFDKHFMKDAFDWVYSIADANKINEIRILSLNLGEQNLNKQAKKDYKRLKEELIKKKISLEWRTIDSDKVKDIHDRWVIGDKSYIRNLPDVNTILSGKRSEMMVSDNYFEVLSSFRNYWSLGSEIS